MSVDTLTMPGMAKKQGGKRQKGDQHLYPPFQMRLHPKLRAQLDELCDRNASSLSEEIRLAIRKHLEGAGLWPPTEQK